MFVTELGAAVVEEDPHGVCGIVGIVFLKHETMAIDQLDAVTGQGFCGCGRSGCGHDEEVLKSARDSVREEDALAGLMKNAPMKVADPARDLEPNDGVRLGVALWSGLGPG